MTQARGTVGSNLRQARTSLGLSLAEVASPAGISVATLSRIETDKQNLDVALLARLAKVLGLPPVEIFGEAADGDHTSLARLLARLPAKERAQAFVAASSHRGAEVSIDDLLSMLDVMREELLKLQHPPRGRRKSRLDLQD